MGQVTIYVDDDALAAARQAAEKAQVSLSQWFARYAVEEKRRQAQSWTAFWAEVDALKQDGDDACWDALLSPETRCADLGSDAPRESTD